MRIRTILISAAAISAPLASVGVATAAHAATKQSSPVTATTSLTNHPDSGFGGNTWASDTITRHATVTQVAPDSTLTDCGPTATACFTYRGTITDTGTAHAIAGQTSP